MTYATKEKNPELIGFAKTLRNVPWCEQYENMISGMSYNGYGPELSNARFRARKLMNKYNTHFPEDATLESLAADREEMLQEMIGSIAKGSCIEPPFTIDYGCNISIGNTFFSNFGLTILDCGIVRIGDRVVCGPNVSIFAITHDTEIESRRKFGEYTKPVTIGNDCWIGANVVIMPGVTIGKGCTIGAASVVTHDIPEFSVAVGSPARVIKKVEPVPDL